MTTTPFEPTDSPDDRVRVEDLEDRIVSEDPDVETLSGGARSTGGATEDRVVPPEEDVAPGAGAVEPTD
ncbi:hypothetical protein [Motilibacter rhizosphaerae]|uniref:hypothetical protein n=1 Tax=Motilibacter rhizosphaerae TaxID=598652 RepID=UPI00102CDE55|nr:hypothetical protein [Motilibacter rhizosphaerae]